MATIIEAYEAINAGKRVFWQDTEVVLSFNTMKWKDANRPLYVTEALLIDWKIKETEPELGYVDCPVSRDGCKQYVFLFYGAYRLLDSAPRYPLIGYVYDNGEVRDTPTIWFGSGLYNRCIAVRIEKENE